MTLLSLTPSLDQAQRCSDFARSIGLNPGGTAIQASLLVAIDTPLPWPKPVFGHDHLAGVEGKFTTKGGPGRVLATVGTGPRTRVRSFWRGPAATMLSTHYCEHPDLGSLMAEMISTGTHAPSFEESRGTAHRAALVCTQGSHDICCGADGVRFAQSLLESTQARWSVDRVSHTGGHRFAPTALTFPDGRMWAFLTEGDAAAIAERSISTRELAPKCRGWWGAAPGAAQVAEIAVWAEVGWDFDDAGDRDVRPISDTTYLVVGMGRQWQVEVVPGRQVPTIACNKPGGRPIKPGQEWDVTEISEC